MSAPGQHFDARLGLAVASARCASRMSRALRIGGGTAIPGRIAERVDPHVLEKLDLRLGHGAIIVAGTNGKTTTARLIADIVHASGRSVVHNRAGANLVGGIVASLTAGLPMTRGQTAVTAVLETDEAALAEILGRISPATVVLTNLFRDQLDRYGELDLVRERWRQPLANLPPTTTLVVNGDDPSLVCLTEGLQARRVLFGIGASADRLTAVPHAAEVIDCWRCGSRLGYRSVFVGHLGDWECPCCGLARPRLDVSGSAIELDRSGCQSLEVNGVGTMGRLTAELPGLYNSYNILGALAATLTLQASPDVTASALSRSRSAFGRAHRVHHNGRDLLVMLVKNAVGCGEVLRTIAGLDPSAEVPILLCLNDAAADGRDVSWIWDVDFEALADSSMEICCAGTRWADLRNRLFYAGVSPTRIRALGTDVSAAVSRFSAALPVGGTGFVLPTYSAMLEVRDVLAKRRRCTAARNG